MDAMRALSRANPAKPKAIRLLYSQHESRRGCACVRSKWLLFRMGCSTFFEYVEESASASTLAVSAASILIPPVPARAACNVLRTFGLFTYCVLYRRMFACIGAYAAAAFCPSRAAPTGLNIIGRPMSNASESHCAMISRWCVPCFVRFAVCVYCTTWHGAHAACCISRATARRLA